MKRMGLEAIAINKEVHLEPKVWAVSSWFLLIDFMLLDRQSIGLK
jgi:hypothetical protein